MDEYCALRSRRGTFTFVVFLQRADAHVFSSNRSYAVDGSRCPRNRRYAGNVMIDGCATNCFFVEKRLTTKRRIDDEIYFAALYVVHDMRPAFVNFVNRFYIDAGTSKHTRRSARCDHLEPDFYQVRGNFRYEILVMLIDTDER